MSEVWSDMLFSISVLRTTCRRPSASTSVSSLSDSPLTIPETTRPSVGGDDRRPIAFHDLARRIQHRLDQQGTLVFAAHVGEIGPDIAAFSSRSMAADAACPFDVKKKLAAAGGVARVFARVTGVCLAIEAAAA